MNELPTGKYKTIYADPPWSESGGGKIKRGADRHYPLMKTREIIDMDVVSLRHPDGCHLYLWTTNNFLKDALMVMDEWGFNYKTMITWVKSEHRPLIGSYVLQNAGLGQYYRGLTEHCLFGAYKALPYKTLDGKRQQGKTVINAPRTKHSKKPEEMRDMIEKVSYAPRIELFARYHPVGWDVWGNEVKETQR